MALGITFFIVAALVIVVWVVIELKRLKHKLLAIFLIALIVFTYVSFTVSLKNKDIDFKSVPGIVNVGKIYFSWLSGVFGNFKTITAFAFKQDWKAPEVKIKNETKDLNESFWDII